MKNPDLASAITERLIEKPKGGNTLLSLLSRAESKQELRLFVPWAVPPSGRSELLTYDTRAIDWLAGEGGLLSTISKFVDQPQLIIMPADSYAKRNGFDMTRANQYWRNIRGYLTTYVPATFILASQMEAIPAMTQLQAEEAYALESLAPKTAAKVLTAAERYSSAQDSSEVYIKAGEYCMARAAEARFVTEVLDALWLSYNWPERDAMCGDSPRLYAPEIVRTPWLQGGET